MEVMIQSPNTSPSRDTFNFNGTMSSPYLSAPSSPKRFGEYYLSAPTSPSRISELYTEFEYFSSTTENSSSSRINNINNVVESSKNDNDDDGGFAFFVGREVDVKSSSAEELFDGGKIKPLKAETNHHESRGRERERNTKEIGLSSKNSGRRVTRSLSPYRKTNSTWELEEQNLHQQQQQPTSIKEETTTTLTSSTSSKGSKRWSLKDLLLFRSASEGRGSSKDPLKKFVGAGHNKKSISNEVVFKGSSFRSSDGSRNKGVGSVHEFQYAMMKAEAQDRKKKTFLPYRQGILGRLSGFGF